MELVANLENLDINIVETEAEIHVTGKEKAKNDNVEALTSMTPINLAEKLEQLEIEKAKKDKLEQLMKKVQKYQETFTDLINTPKIAKECVIQDEHIKTSIGHNDRKMVFYTNAEGIEKIVVCREAFDGKVTEEVITDETLDKLLNTGIRDKLRKLITDTITKTFVDIF